MSDVFADTYYFIALVGPDNFERRKAVQATAMRKGRLITTAWIITELGNFLHRVPDRKAFLSIFYSLRNDPDVLIIDADPDLFTRGVLFYESRPDKEWSLTDCISFVAMQEAGISDALTGDHHFEQAGFNALLR